MGGKSWARLRAIVWEDGRECLNTRLKTCSTVTYQWRNRQSVVWGFKARALMSHIPVSWSQLCLLLPCVNYSHLKLTKNYKTLLREIKQDLKKWREIPSSWIGALTFVQMLLLLTLVYKFCAIPIKISTGFVLFFFLKKLQINTEIYLEMP